MRRKPLGWSLVLSSRSALLMIPQIKNYLDQHHEDGAEQKTLSVMRACLLSLLSSRGELQDRLRARSAARALTRQGKSRSVRVAMHAAYAAAGYPNEASSSDHASIAIAETLDQPASSELELVIDLLDQGSRAEEITALPLWKTDMDAASLENWTAARGNLLRENPNWLPWIRWYEGLVAGKENREVNNAFLHAGNQPDEWWDRTLGKIRADLDDWITTPQSLAEHSEKDSESNEAETSLPRFVVSYLKREGSPRTIDQIRAALHLADRSFIDKSLRGTLSTLARRGTIQRVETGIYQFPSLPSVPVPPSQGHGPHLGIDKGHIVFAPVQHIDEPDTDIARVERFLPMARDTLLEFLTATPSPLESKNDPFSRERRIANRYLEASSGDVQTLDFDLLFGAGTLLMNRLVADTKRSLESDLAPFSDAQRLALEDFRANHGPMIAATKAGAEAIADAEMVIRNPDEERRFRETVIEFMHALQAEKDLAKPEVAQFLGDAAAEMGTGHQAERSFRFGQGAARNTAIVVTSVGVITVLPIAGLALGGIAGTIAAGVLSYVLWEATKKSKPFSNAIRPLTGMLDGLSELDQRKLEQLIDSGTSERFARFTLREEARLRAIAGDRPEFEWLHRQLDFLKANYKQD